MYYHKKNKKTNSFRQIRSETCKNKRKKSKDSGYKSV